MAIIPHNKNIEQALKWLHSNAEATQSLIKAKAQWYDRYHEQYWRDWFDDVFNLSTASDFGIVVWCAILGVPSGRFGFEPFANNWAYGSNRQNFVFDPEGSMPGLENPNLVGGNFFGGSEGTVSNPDEIRNLLKLRYVALVHNGTISFINRMLRHIYNDGEPWDFASGKYFYLMDVTGNSGGLELKAVYQDDWEGRIRLQSVPHTNFIIQSDSLNLQPWRLTNTTLPPVTIPVPDGAPLRKLTAFATPGAREHSVSQTVPTEQGVHRLSVFLHPDQITQAMVQLGTAQTGIVSVMVDLPSASIIRRTGRVISSGIERVGDGMVKVNFVADIQTTFTEVTIYQVKDGEVAFENIIEGQGVYVGRVMLTKGAESSRYMQTLDNAVTQTDYTVNTSTGAVVTGYTPTAGVKLLWQGIWGAGSAEPSQEFGVGDGTTVNYQINMPANYNEPVDGIMAVEYRIGPELAVSGQFLQLLRDPSVGVLPQFSGVRYSVIQE